MPTHPDPTEPIARWLRDWDTDFSPGHPPWEEMDEANRDYYRSGARELAKIVRSGVLERTGRFEELLAAEDEQFDGRSELLASIVDYTNAPSSTVSPDPARHVGWVVRAGWLGVRTSDGRLHRPDDVMFVYTPEGQHG